MRHLLERSTLSISGIDFEVSVFLARGHTARATVRDGRISVVLPAAMTVGRRLALKDKMLAMMAKKVERKPARFAYKRLAFHEGDEFDVLGIRYFVSSASHGLAGNSREIVVKLPDSCTEQEREKLIFKKVSKEVAKTAAPLLAERVDRINQMHFNSEIRKVRISSATTRWGSYSSGSKTVMLNFKLLFAPTEVLDFVIVHELAHTKRLDHSERFWNRVGSIIPDYMRHRRWLIDNGNKICLGASYDEKTVLGRPVYEGIQGESRKMLGEQGSA